MSRLLAFPLALNKSVLSTFVAAGFSLSGNYPPKAGLYERPHRCVHSFNGLVLEGCRIFGSRALKGR